MNIYTVLRNIVHADATTTNTQSDLFYFILGCDEGQVTFTNDLGETYIISTQDGDHYTLSLPDGDYTGDPGVVTAFNNLMTK